MDHVAIMRADWGLLPKLRSGQKTIESRWYKHKSCPWGRIGSGDTVYFKDSGSPVRLRAKVHDVLQFAGLTPRRVTELLKQYGSADGIEPEKLPFYADRFRDKRYCLLIFLECVEAVAPFEIDKTGFGAMAAWLSVPTIEEIRK